MQNGATSIVGQCIIQLARYRGIHSINIIRDRCLFKILAQISSAGLLPCFPICNPFLQYETITVSTLISFEGIFGPTAHVFSISVFCPPRINHFFKIPIHTLVRENMWQ